MLSLAVVLLGAPAVVQHHNGATGSATTRASHAAARSADDSAR
jgi:hypothetical protein